MKEKISAASVKIDKKNNFAPHLDGAAYVFKESFLVYLRSGTIEPLQTAFNCL